MPALSSLLMAASAAIILLLGLAHLLFTFRGSKLHPRDAALAAAMRQISPVLTRQTTMWKAWIGFNASHSIGAIFFGMVYGYLALAQPVVLFGSLFLRLAGLAALLGYVLLARAYWFSIPLRGIAASILLYLAALAANQVPIGGFQ
jgi:hypothetical protein